MIVRLLPGVLNNGCCTDNEQPSEIAISLLGDVPGPLIVPLAAAAQVGAMREISTGFEVTRVCDSGSDGRGPNHAYPGHGLEATAHIIGTMMSVNGAILGAD